jgi:hypothetical protein
MKFKYFFLQLETPETRKASFKYTGTKASGIMTRRQFNGCDFITWKYCILKSTEKENGKILTLQRQEIRKEELKGAPDGAGYHSSKEFDWKLRAYPFEIHRHSWFSSPSSYVCCD